MILTSSTQSLIDRLPQTRGKYRENAQLSTMSWFGVGGSTDIFFKPEDAEDLAFFLKNCPSDIPITIIGVASNLLIRDGGIPGVVIRLGRGFTEITHDLDRNEITAGAAALDINVAKYALMQSMEGLEFLSGIPGTIGGAICMNAGAYGREIKDCLLYAEAFDRHGKLYQLTPDELQFTYRHSIAQDQKLFITKACFRAQKIDSPDIIKARMDDITTARELTQPIHTRTGGSTFRNPEGHKAWQLIEKVGGRGYRVGGAHFSDLHCNFIVNDLDASAADIETLGNTIQKRVLDELGIPLMWEIKIIGNALTDDTHSRKDKK